MLTVGFKHKGKFVFFGLSHSGKASLIKLLYEDGLIDTMPYPNSSYELVDSGEFFFWIEFYRMMYVQAYGRNLASCSSWGWIMQGKQLCCTCSRMIGWHSTFQLCIPVSYFLPLIRLTLFLLIKYSFFNDLL